MIELKPCPFCGGEASLITISSDNRYFAVCDDCDNRTNECFEVEEAIEAWNRRVSE